MSFFILAATFLVILLAFEIPLHVGFKRYDDYWALSIGPWFLVVADPAGCPSMAELKMWKGAMLLYEDADRDPYTPLTVVRRFFYQEWPVKRF